jgi:hypothetical protein
MSRYQLAEARRANARVYIDIVVGDQLRLAATAEQWA